MVSLRNVHSTCQQGETSHRGLQPQINIKGGDFIHVAFGYGLALMVGICVSGGVSGGRLAFLSLVGEDNSKPTRPSQPCSDLGYGCDEEASLGPVAGERVIKSFNIPASAFQVYWAGQYLGAFVASLVLWGNYADAIAAASPGDDNTIQATAGIFSSFPSYSTEQADKQCLVKSQLIRIGYVYFKLQR